MNMMSHIHTDGIIVDSDVHFTIDPITRVISNRNGEAVNKKLILTQYDNKSERYSFDIDRKVDGHDLLDCNRVTVHFINIGSGKQQNIGICRIDDMRVHDTNPNKVTFSWLITQNATMLSGVLSFLIAFECVDGETVLYRWSTTTFEGIRITNGMNNNNDVMDVYVDELLAWQHSMELEVLPNLVDECYIEREFATSAEVGRIFDIYDPFDNDLIGIDAIPTDGSGNLITSGGVKVYADRLFSESKTYTDVRLNTKADKETTYTKTEVDKMFIAADDAYDDTEIRENIVELQNGKADKSNTYTKDEIDNIVDNVQVDLSDYYTKSETYNKGEIDNIVDNVQVDLSDYYTKSETYNKDEINELVDNVEVDLSDYITNSDLEGKGYATTSALESSLSGKADNSTVSALNDKVTTLENANSTNQSNISALQNNKVDKTEFENLEYVKKLTVADDLIVFTREDDTNLTVNNFTTSERTKLSGLKNYDDSSIKQSITNLQNTKANQTSLDTTNQTVSTMQTKLNTIEEGAEVNTVDSVNGKTGVVQLNATDIGALPSDTPLFSGNYNDLSNKPTIPTKITDLQNDSDFATRTDLSTKANNSTVTTLSNKVLTLETATTNLETNKLDKDEWNSYNAANTFKVINNVSDVPTADAANEGKMIFYLGANSTNPYILSYGHYYKCNYVNSTYEWTDITQDPSLEGVANGIREINNNQTIQLWVGTKEELEDETTQPNVLYVPQIEDDDGVIRLGDIVIPQVKIIMSNDAGVQNYTFSENITGRTFEILFNSDNNSPVIKSQKIKLTLPSNFIVAYIPLAIEDIKVINNQILVYKNVLTCKPNNMALNYECYNISNPNNMGTPTQSISGFIYKIYEIIE